MSSRAHSAAPPCPLRHPLRPLHFPWRARRREAGWGGGAVSCLSKRTIPSPPRRLECGRWCGMGVWETIGVGPSQEGPSWRWGYAPQEAPWVSFPSLWYCRPREVSRGARRRRRWLGGTPARLFRCRRGFDTEKVIRYSAQGGWRRREWRDTHATKTSPSKTWRRRRAPLPSSWSEWPRVTGGGGQGRGAERHGRRRRRRHSWDARTPVPKGVQRLEAAHYRPAAPLRSHPWAGAGPARVERLYARRRRCGRGMPLFVHGAPTRVSPAVGAGAAGRLRPHGLRGRPAWEGGTPVGGGRGRRPARHALFPPVGRLPFPLPHGAAETPWGGPTPHRAAVSLLVEDPHATGHRPPPPPPPTPTARSTRWSAPGWQAKGTHESPVSHSPPWRRTKGEEGERIGSVPLADGDGSPPHAVRQRHDGSTPTTRCPSPPMGQGDFLCHGRQQKIRRRHLRGPLSCSPPPLWCRLLGPLVSLRPLAMPSVTSFLAGVSRRWGWRRRADGPLPLHHSLFAPSWRGLSRWSPLHTRKDDVEGERGSVGRPMRRRRTAVGWAWRNARREPFLKDEGSPTRRAMEWTRQMERTTAPHHPCCYCYCGDASDDYFFGSPRSSFPRLPPQPRLLPASLPPPCPRHAALRSASGRASMKATRTTAGGPHCRSGSDDRRKSAAVDHSGPSATPRWWRGTSPLGQRPKAATAAAGGVGWKRTTPHGVAPRWPGGGRPWPAVRRWEGRGR